MKNEINKIKIKTEVGNKNSCKGGGEVRFKCPGGQAGAGGQVRLKFLL
jgi:hypothetical protein